MYTDFLPGDWVKRQTNSKGDYANGRVGQVLQQNENQSRTQVHWKFDATGSTLNIKTWVDTSTIVATGTPEAAPKS